MPVHGFFEYNETATSRQLCYFTSRSSPLVGLAGIYARIAGQRGYDFIILTTRTNAPVSRMRPTDHAWKDDRRKTRLAPWKSQSTQPARKRTRRSAEQWHTILNGMRPTDYALAELLA